MCVRTNAAWCKVIAVLIAIMLMLTACSDSVLGLLAISGGQGDWRVELFNGYFIDRVNSKEIVLVYKNDPSSIGYSFVMEDNFFITAYQTEEPYVCLEGIATKERHISDEERASGVLSYYLCDTTDGSIAGPFSSKTEFIEYGNSVGLAVTDAWIQTKDIKSEDFDNQ